MWDDVFLDRAFLDGIGTPLVADKDDVVHLSLVWLMLHELQHYALGHFDLIGRAYLTETHHAHRFALVTHATAKLTFPDGAEMHDWVKVEPCLELQADHDAIELLLYAYSVDDWPSLRARIAAISTMFVLIEREDNKLRVGHSSHPKAATRIFQLLGHLTDMPMITAHQKIIEHKSNRVDAADLPSESEQRAFYQQVVIPALFDAINLARIAGAVSIADDLADEARFFDDIRIAKLGDTQAFSDLKSVGAREWADLVAFNEKLKQRLGFGN